MKKILIFISLAASLNGFAQKEKEKQKGYEPSRLFTGGSISLGFSGGSYSTFLAGLHPHIGYSLTRWLDVAGVVNFEYQSQRDPYNDKIHSTTYGLGAFTRIFPVRFIFLQVEPEYNFINQKYISSAGTFPNNLNAPSLLLGGGYTTSRWGNTFTYISILVDVLQDKSSPYVDGYGNMLPVIRAGINIGLEGKRRK